MQDDTIYSPAWKGSKTYRQQQTPTANATGFGAATDDYAERGIDLNEELVTNKPATFFFRMNGDAMIDAGIHSGDILIVDRSVKAIAGKIVVAAVNGELLVRRLFKTLNRLSLTAENNRYATMELNECSECNIWGVVTWVIHRV